jgi:hypothetical protein
MTIRVTYTIRRKGKVIARAAAEGETDAIARAAAEAQKQAKAYNFARRSGRKAFRKKA